MKHLYAGCYTAKTGSKGLYQFSFDESSGQLTFKTAYDTCDNPSFLAAEKDMIYAGSEAGQGGGLYAFRRHITTGDLTYINHTAVPGSALCHVQVWPNGKYLSAANYGSGSLAVCEILKDGSLGRVTDLKQHHGVGFDKHGRQEGPHVHATLLDPSGKKLLASDLGLDWLARYDIDACSGTLALDESVHFKTPDGSGPRHFTFSEDGETLYVVTEMGNSLLVYDYADARGVTYPRQQMPLLPDSHEGESNAADLHISPDGQFMYVSNRGHDSLTVLRVHEADGSVEWIECCCTYGAVPRNFCITPDGQYVIIANQKSGNIVVCKRDLQSGTLSEPSSQVSVPQPVFVMLL